MGGALGSRRSLRHHDLPEAGPVPTDHPSEHESDVPLVQHALLDFRRPETALVGTIVHAFGER
jgi:hypothetical protein